MMSTTKVMRDKTPRMVIGTTSNHQKMLTMVNTLLKGTMTNTMRNLTIRKGTREMNNTLHGGLHQWNVLGKRIQKRNHGMKAKVIMDHPSLVAHGEHIIHLPGVDLDTVDMAYLHEAGQDHPLHVEAEEDYDLPLWVAAQKDLYTIVEEVLEEGDMAWKIGVVLEAEDTALPGILEDMYNSVLLLVLMYIV